jgi:hypothetical protein
MRQDVKQQLIRLNEDYRTHMGNGQSFQHFFCPILQIDENTELIKAHIVNQSFPDSPKDWTVQRKDVDGFYGTHFESGFTKLQYAGTKVEDILADSSLYNKLYPFLLHDNQPVEMYPDKGHTPAQHSPIVFSDAGNKLFSVKMHPNELKEKMRDNWEIGYQVDTTLESIVSLIKSAHLTLFHLLGYRYARTSTSYFVGNDILGRFFRKNCYEKDRKIVRDNAALFFEEFKQIVRPVEALGWTSQGTVTDKTLLVCRNISNNIWAMVVFVYIGGEKPFHAVLTPLAHDEDSAVTFDEFLKKRIRKIEFAHCRFESEHEAWNMDNNWYSMDWVQG